jgi:hypothetical protein
MPAVAATGRVSQAGQVKSVILDERQDTLFLQVEGWVFVWHPEPAKKKRFEKKKLFNRRLRRMETTV